MQDMVEHSAYLAELASGCEVVVEFGVRAPDDTSSTMSLLRGAKRRLVSYDIEHCGVDAVVRLARELGKEFEFKRANSLEVWIEGCELLMIDSLHTYKQLKEELLRHHNRVAKYIVMHDTELFGYVGEDERHPGLQLAVAEFMVAYPSWILHSHTRKGCGLTVLEKK
jgi:hypothetical protein